MPNLINQMMARELAEAFVDAEGMLIVSMSGLTVLESEALRIGLAEHGVRLRMVRNRLAQRALSERGYAPPDDLFGGNIAMAWGTPEDAIHAARVVAKSGAKKAGKLAIRGGLLDGELLSAEQANALSKLPGRDELRAMMLSAFSGPARGLVGVVAAPGAALARVLQARADQLQAQGEDA